MNIENVEKKLEEARTFLEAMRNEEKKAFGHKDFDVYLSAFLSAGRSVDYRLCHEQAATYPAWRKKWNATHIEEDRLMKYMHDDHRDVEVHESGSKRLVKTKELKVGMGGSYSDSSGTLTVMGSPGPLIGTDTSATISMPEYFFTIEGNERKATDVCAEYLTVLEGMVESYKADNP